MLITRDPGYINSHGPVGWRWRERDINSHTHTQRICFPQTHPEEGLEPPNLSQAAYHFTSHLFEHKRGPTQSSCATDHVSLAKACYKVAFKLRLGTPPAYVVLGVVGTLGLVVPWLQRSLYLYRIMAYCYPAKGFMIGD